MTTAHWILTPPDWKNTKEANLQKAKTFIEQAAQQHADLICFPEMFSTGYFPDVS